MGFGSAINKYSPRKTTVSLVTAQSLPSNALCVRQDTRESIIQAECLYKKLKVAKEIL